MYVYKLFCDFPFDFIIVIYINNTVLFTKNKRREKT